MLKTTTNEILKTTTTTVWMTSITIDTSMKNEEITTTTARDPTYTILETRTVNGNKLL